MTISAALLHDAVEDTGFGLTEIDGEFGPEVAAIVDGVTKLDRVRFDSRQAQQAATMRKMLVAMAKDPRVLLIKLADRLHNMQTIAAMPEWKQKRSAQETLDIYAPLAHRFGIQDIKWQLEDLAFAALHPRRYAEIEQMVATRAPERDIYLAQVIDHVNERLARRPHRRPGHGPAQAPVLDLREDDRQGQGVRRDLRPGRGAGPRRLGQGLLGRAGRHPRGLDPGAGPVQGLHQHAQVQPLPVPPHHGGRARRARPIEAQIRTIEMHNRAEWGIAAHWGYKEKASAADVAWLQRIVDWSAESTDPAEFLEALKLDLETDEVFVFTPKGDVISLPIHVHPHRLRLRHPHRGGAPLHRGPGQRTAGAARLAAVLRRQRRDLHLQGALRGSQPGLAQDRGQPAGPQQDPPVVQPGAPRGRHRVRARGADEGAAQRGPAGAEAGQLGGPGPRRRDASTTPTSTPSTPPSARTTCRLSPSPSGSPASCAAASTRSSCRARPASPAGSTSARASASTSRVSMT